MKFFVFDMDGILVDTSRCHSRAYADLWGECGVEGPEYSSIAGRPTREVVEEYTRPIGPSAELVREWVAFKQDRARSYIRTETVVFDDVLPCFEALRRVGARMAVATGASRRTAEMLLDRAQIMAFFEFMLTAEDVRHGKPDPEIYRKAAEKAGAETVVVEDSSAGLRAAAAAPASFACVRSGLTLPSPFFLGSYRDLLEFSRAMGVEV